MTAGVYLIHFDPPYKHARHYVGFAEDIDARLRAHRDGHGARLTQVAVAHGCELILARVWPGGDRTLERHLKQQKRAPHLCPVCGRKHAQLHLYMDTALDFTLEDVDELAF